ncbi:hypothetical protein OZX74_01630 [Bifidobacterium sp. ESL0798]|uniref:hypothetical protein n=1 Tax=Bifidobacterium sp. ESL0798 TaxID=2983235 RepID=UPI0023F8FF05|nr:hypothetical protein [Bifidobacterium sp. ESL0798]WEV74285.1 hypothetical protein OZX74_01630 [Bifidobacterium sp. ESL0798]
MPNAILRFDHASFETELDRLVVERAEELLNAMLNMEAGGLTASKRYERGLTVKAGDMTVRGAEAEGRSSTRRSLTAASGARRASMRP